MADKDTSNEHVSRLRVLFLANTIHAVRKRRLLMQTTMHNLLARRRRLLYVCSLVMLLLSQRNVKARVPRLRSCRRFIRNEGWWNKVWNTYSDARFKRTLRVSRATFHFILSSVGHVLQRQTVTEEPISPEERLGICLFSKIQLVVYHQFCVLIG